MRLTRSQVEEFRALLRKEGRAAAGEFLLEGSRALGAAIAADVPIVAVAVRTDQLQRDELMSLRARGVPSGGVSERELKRISATEQSQGVVARVRIVRHELPGLLGPGNRLLLALDAISDPGNLGTILRTADWFAADGVLLGGGCVDPFNDKVVRAAAGSLFQMPFAIDLDLLAALRQAKADGFQIVAADANGPTPFGNWWPARRTIIVLGSEAHGVSPGVGALADVRVAVPRFGRAESLNVGIAAGILLAHVRMSG